LWDTTRVSNDTAGSPVISHGAVYVGSDKLYAFGLEKVPPTTSMVIQSNGATLSGNTTLDAKASDNVKVTRVEFHLTGDSNNDELIAVATPTPYGWLGQWDTTSVPNGTYTLNSVAYEAAGNVGRSANVNITVQN
jgi:thermitase